MKFHEAAEEFPLLDEKRLNELAADIKANSQRVPILLCGGKILDGRNRFLACKINGIEPVVTDGFDGDPYAYVWSLNGERRDLQSAEQRYLIWDSLHGKSEAWQKKQERAQEAANRKRSEAAKDGKVGRAAAKYVLDFEMGQDRERQQEFSAATDSGTTKPNRSSTAKAAASKTNRGAVERMDMLKKEAPELAEKVKKGEIKSNKAVSIVTRKRKIEAIAEPAAVSGLFPVVYADPPWQYEHSKTSSRDIENQYPTMPIPEICAMEIPATEDAILFMWATAPKLREAFDVLDGWGFTYRTCAVWDKRKIGMGYYFRGQHELLLVATRGDIPAPPEAARPPSVINEPRGGHSKKPEVVYSMIEAMYPELRKLELFARKKRKGWESWGNEADA